MMLVENQTKWVPRDVDDADRARVFCIPYSGCGASMYREWPTEVGGIGFYPVQPPGRENRMREPAHTQYRSLAEDMVAAVEPYLDRPFLLFGHCGSALAAYEAACVIESRGLRSPSALVVSSEVAPQDGPYGFFLALDRDGLRREIAALFSGLGVTPPSELLELTLDVLETDLEMNRQYHHDDPQHLECPIVTLGWDEDQGIPVRLMSGWRLIGPTKEVVLPGDHYEFVTAPPALMSLLTKLAG